MRTMNIRSLVFVLAVAAGFATTASAAVVTDGGTTGLKTDTSVNHFNVSFFSGNEGYSTVAGDGSINVAFNSEVVDYGFYRNSNDPYATDAGSDRVGQFVASGNIGEGPYIWTTTNPSGGAGTHDIFDGARRSNAASGTVDLTGFSNDYVGGSLYIFHGMFTNTQRYDNVTVTISDDDAVLSPEAVTSTTTFSGSASRFFVTRIDFSDIAGYETLTYTHNTFLVSDDSASEGYFAGVVLTGAPVPVPAPASLAMGVVGVGALLTRRRR